MLGLYIEEPSVSVVDNLFTNKTTRPRRFRARSSLLYDKTIQREREASCLPHAFYCNQNQESLARRGDKSAIPRALEVFAVEGPTNMAGVPHRNLQKRLLVLLSNSAHKNGITQPAFKPEITYNESESSRIETK
jgi:hypothetical protein